MALTYDPFARAPQLRYLDSRVKLNLADGERIGSVVLGGGITAASLAREGWTRIALLVVGAALIARGIAGRCLAYEKMGISSRGHRNGVPGNGGHRLEAAIEIQCPAAPLFSFWRKLENLPQVMRHVKSVEARDPRFSHWQVEGPAGQVFAWDAEIINEHQDQLIAWQSLDGATVRNAGSVRFEPKGDGITRVKIALEFDSPAGAVGVALAPLLGMAPEAELQEDLQRFKEYAERHLTPR